MEIEYSEQIKAELTRLKPTDQRFRQINKGIASIQLDPFKTDNLINDLKPYKAEKAASQIRIFYEILSDENKIFLVWVNPEEFPHDTNNGQDRDPCYLEFSRLYRADKLEKYVPASITESEFTISGTWGEEILYCSLKKGMSFTDSHLFLQAVGKNEYEITHFSSQSAIYEEELEILLLMIDKARGYKVCFTYQLHLNIELIEIENKRSSLHEAGFELILTDEDSEFWQKEVA